VKIMNWDFFKNRSWLGSDGGQARFVSPALVLEIEPSFVVGARLDSAGRSLRRIAMRGLEPQTINPLPNGPNITNSEQLRRALTGVVEVIGNGSKRLGLLLPDGSVRVAILKFETLSGNFHEVEALVRWKMKEILPYPSEEAKLSYQVLWREPGDVGLLGVAAKTTMLAEYEQALGLNNGGPGLILPSTIALLPLVPETEGGAQLLVHVCSGWVTAVLIKGSRVLSWRTKELDNAVPEDLGKDLASEVNRILASSRDRLQIEVEKVWLCARPTAASELATELSRAISKEVRGLEPHPELAATLPAAEKAVFDSVGAPVAGLISNHK
jgi:hypothetical protein